MASVLRVGSGTGFLGLSYILAKSQVDPYDGPDCIRQHLSLINFDAIAFSKAFLKFLAKAS